MANKVYVVTDEAIEAGLAFLEEVQAQREYLERQRTKGERLAHANTAEEARHQALAEERSARIRALEEREKALTRGNGVLEDKGAGLAAAYERDAPRYVRMITKLTGAAEGRVRALVDAADFGAVDALLLASLARAA